MLYCKVASDEHDIVAYLPIQVFRVSMEEFSGHRYDSPLLPFVQRVFKLIESQSQPGLALHENADRVRFGDDIDLSPACPEIPREDPMTSLFQVAYRELFAKLPSVNGCRYFTFSWNSL